LSVGSTFPVAGFNASGLLAMGNPVMGSIFVGLVPPEMGMSGLESCPCGEVGNGLEREDAASGCTRTVGLGELLVFLLDCKKLQLCSPRVAKIANPAIAAVDGWVSFKE
jgi:hypothetical protein